VHDTSDGVLSRHLLNSANNILLVGGITAHDLHHRSSLLHILN
jgi:hypothetical protein